MATNNAINTAYPIGFANGGTGATSQGTALTAILGSSQVGVASGGTGVGTLTSNGVLLGAGTGNVTASTAFTANGQLLIGNGSSAPSVATLTAGAGITITNSAGGITIAAPGGGFTWTTSASTTLVAENGYVATGSAQAVFTLPASAVLGDQFVVMSSTGNTGFIQVVTTGSQTIRLGNVNAATSLTGTAIGDSLHIVCVVAGTTSAGFQVLSSVGNFTTA